MELAMSDEVNGVPLEKMFGAIAKVKESSDLAQFEFVAENEWITGTGSRSSIHEWHGMGGDHLHVEKFTYESDHPTLGHGHGPTPHEYVLHALLSCVTAGIVTGAAARNIQLHKITSKVSGEIDVRGLLGVDPDVRKGFSSIEVEFDIEADCSGAEKDALLAAGAKYSAVFDSLSNPTEVNISRKA